MYDDYGVKTYASAVLTLAIGIYLAWPCHFDGEEFSVPDAPEMDGVYHPRHCTAHRNGRQMLKLPPVIAPESMVFDSTGTLYLGSRYGAIWKVQSANRAPKLLTHVGDIACGPEEEGSHCGRPLGMRMYGAKALIVVDLFNGLMTIDTETGGVRPYLTRQDEVQGHDTNWLNDLDVDEKTGMVYMSQSTTRWKQKDGDYDFLEARCSGRLLSYHIPSGEVKVVSTGLCFPNGVQISDDRKSVIVAETTRYQLSRISLVDSPSAKRGEKTVLDNNIIGYPDNVRAHPDGGYLLAVPSLRQRAKESERYFVFPSIRRLMWKVLPKAVYSMLESYIRYGMCVHYHANGTMLETYHFDDFKTFLGVSQCTVAPDNRTLYAVTRLDESVVVTPLA